MAAFQENSDGWVSGIHKGESEPEWMVEVMLHSATQRLLPTLLRASQLSDWLSEEKLHRKRERERMRSQNKTEENSSTHHSFTSPSLSLSVISQPRSAALPLRLHEDDDQRLDTMHPLATDWRAQRSIMAAGVCAAAQECS